MDTHKLALLAAEFIDMIEKDPDRPDNLELGEVVMAGELRWVDDEGLKRICITTASTTDNRIHQTGIFTWGLDMVSDYGEAMDDGDNGE